MGPQVTAWFHPPHVCSVVHVPVTCVHPAHLDPLTSWPSFYILKAICAGETGRADSVLGALHKEAWWRYSFVGGQRTAFLFPACLHSLYPHFYGRRFYFFLSIYRASPVVQWLKKKKNPPAYAGNTRDSGSIPGLGRSPGVGNGNLLQYFCLENFMDRGAWQAPRGLEELDTAECTAFTNEPDS